MPQQTHDQFHATLIRHSFRIRLYRLRRDATYHHELPTCFLHLPLCVRDCSCVYTLVPLDLCDPGHWCAGLSVNRPELSDSLIARSLNSEQAEWLCPYTGADDVFVFIDAWRQSARAGEHVNQNILTRMSYAYKRAAKAMLITSTTTFGAFVATATSPLGEVACFGIFTALLVLANYVFVITYFPAVLIIYHRHFENTKGCCCYVGGRTIPAAAPYKPQSTVEPAPAPESQNPPPATAGTLTNVEDVKGQVSVLEPKPQKIEIFCTEKFAPIVATPARFVFLAVTTIFAIIMLTQAVELGPTTKEDQLL